MIRFKCLFLLAVLSAFLCLALPVGLAEPGDVNQDGAVDVQDARNLRDFLVGNAAGIYEAAADMNGDGAVALDDLVILERELNALGPDVTPPPTPGGCVVREEVYGQSELGRDLVCTVIEPEAFSRTLLAIFSIHGFEDAYDHDGQVLVDMANQTIEHFRTADLHDCRLLIVACANPDGLLDGITNDGFGRCNANGVDLNRDFDAAHIVMTNPRNYTLSPFSAAESRALRDLVWQYQPDVVLDCHGWLNYTIGDSELAKVFYDEMGLAHHVTFSDNAHGYFSYWAHQQGALALLVEFTGPAFAREPFLNAMDRLVAGDYETDTGIYTEDEAFAGFSPINTYALSQGTVTTYTDIEGDAAGWIDGASDLCSLQKIYANGWARVSYPISAGNRIAYCPLDQFIDPNQRTAVRAVRFAGNQTVYRRQDLGASIGTVYATDTAYSVARTDDAVQIIYPLDSGGWKMGWVPVEVCQDPVLPRAVRTVDSGGSAQLSCRTGTAHPGETIDLTVSLQAEDLAAARLWLMYDAEALELVSVANGDCLAGMTTGDDLTASLYCMLWADSLREAPCASDGTLAVLSFRVKADAVPQEASVMLFSRSGDAFSAELAAVSLAASAGRVIVTAPEVDILRLPEDIVAIEAEAFAGCDFDTVCLDGAELRTIGSRAFADCERLRSVYIASTVNDIAEDTFDGSPGLVVHCSSDSYALDYCVEHGIAYVIDNGGI